MAKILTQEDLDERINALHEQARNIWPKLETIIDELKALGPHSSDHDNALANIRDWLYRLSQR
ncbi:hypothetical protein [Herbaspirillum sp. NPDC087042]|uniref:hypothetical protein n=1 Tax=Herbaspirillum sp. NPDC087042 TaxID=3364004 RepID=UPI0037FA8D6D